MSSYIRMSGNGQMAVLVGVDQQNGGYSIDPAKLPETPPKLCFPPHIGQLFHYTRALNERYGVKLFRDSAGSNLVDYMISERDGEILPRICCAKWYQSRDHVPFLDPCEKFKTKKKMADFFRSCILAPGAYRLIDAVFEPRLPVVAKIDYAEIERRADIHATTARALLKLDPIDTGRTRKPAPPGMDLSRMYEKHQNLALNYGMSFEDYKKFKERIKQENQET